jgi:hypothetical protein
MRSWESVSTKSLGGRPDSQDRMDQKAIMAGMG